MAAGVTIQAKRKAGAFIANDLAAGELGVDVSNGDIYSSVDGTSVFIAGAGAGLSAIVEDTSPQLGGQLDVNGNGIGDGTLELLVFTEIASAINHINITNAIASAGPILSAVGDDTNIDLNLDGKGSGEVNVLSNLDVTGNIIVSGTVDGIDVGVDVAANTAKTGVTTEISDIVEDTSPQLGGQLDAQSNKIVALLDPTLAQDAATKAYVDSVAQGLNWQPSVLNTQTDASLDPGGSPTTGDRYIIEDEGALHANFGTISGVGTDDIVEYDGADFVVDLDVSVVGEGYSTYDDAAGNNKVYNGTAWINMGGAADHSTLSNLTVGDPHTQYSLIASGSAAPVSTPARIGLIYMETTSPALYVSSGSSSSADWELQVNHTSTLDNSGMTIDGGTI